VREGGGGGAGQESSCWKVPGWEGGLNGERMALMAGVILLEGAGA